jgi:alkanesulfonate monooxygenase SsuD/methylene tetrahydromethanopterin reductase-like flavin-dependent oxidoreductase (luciferase family)
MDLGICVASHIQDIDYIVHAESLGYSHAWLADSQMIWSDCYATLALAASKTSHIKLGTGVAITGTRPPAVNAAGIATINAIAPGRTFFGVGAGNTAMRIMGLPPHKINQLDQYLTEIAPLLKGEESLVQLGHKQSLIRHVMQDKGFVNFDDAIPMYVSGFGPRSLGLAGKHGDGAVVAFAASPGGLEAMWAMIESGAEANQRTINRDEFYMSALTTMVVLDEGEAIDSDRVKHECGAFAMAAVHYAYDQFRNFGHQPPNHLSGIWDDYTKLVEQVPEERRHQRIHAGHNCWVIPEEERFVNADTISASCLVGTKDQLIEQLSALGEAGLDQVMLLPPFDPRYDVIDRVAKDILPHIR